MATEITIAIGSGSQTYTLVRTTAPKPYDHGQAIEMYEGGGERYILVPNDALTWQEGPNRSGLHGFELSDLIPTGSLAEQLWARILPRA